MKTLFTGKFYNKLYNNWRKLIVSSVRLGSIFVTVCDTGTCGKIGPDKENTGVSSDFGQNKDALSLQMWLHSTALCSRYDSNHIYTTESVLQVKVPLNNKLTFILYSIYMKYNRIKVFTFMNFSHLSAFHKLAFFKW